MRSSIENVNDVQINRTSIVDENGVANVPIGSGSVLGVVRSGVSYGAGIWSDGQLRIYGAPASEIKTGTNAYCPIVPSKQHISAFYGLAKAAGHDEKDSTLSVGTYTEDAKSKISEMRFKRSVLMEALAYTLYKWLGVQGICLASQTVVLPCSFSTALILFPICTSLTFDIKNAWNCISCSSSRGSTPYQSNKLFHAVINTAFHN